MIGATLMTRDGLCVVNRSTHQFSPETFSAMSATLMSAAETALYELGGGKRVRVIAETDRRKMIAVGASDEFLLVAMTEANVKLQDALLSVEQTVSELKPIIEG